MKSITCYTKRSCYEKTKRNFNKITLLKKLKPLHTSAFGSVHMVIARGNIDELSENIKAYNPVIMDILPLTLEEVFIYELGGMGYEFKDILL